jgi:hypothetical protein
MPNRKRLLSVFTVFAAVCAFVLCALSTGTGAQSGYRLKAAVIGAAGSSSSGSGVVSNGTLGQPASEVSSGASGDLLHTGFWKSWLWSPSTDDELPDAARNELFQNYPNPFNPATTIRYSVAREGDVDLIVYNVKGQKVRTLVDSAQPAGSYSAVWDGRNDGGRSVSTGVYFYRLRTGSYSEVKKMVLLR